jgi:hypothetical protein
VVSPFKDGCISMEGDVCIFHPSTSHTEESVSVVRNVIRGDRRMSTHEEVAAQVGLYYGTCHMRLAQGLGMEKSSKTFISWVTTLRKRNTYAKHISCVPLTILSEIGPSLHFVLALKHPNWKLHT